MIGKLRLIYNLRLIGKLRLIDKLRLNGKLLLIGKRKLRLIGKQAQAHIQSPPH